MSYSLNMFAMDKRSCSILAHSYQLLRKIILSNEMKENLEAKTFLLVRKKSFQSERNLFKLETIRNVYLIFL